MEFSVDSFDDRGGLRPLLGVEVLLDGRAVAYATYTNNGGTEVNPVIEFDESICINNAGLDPLPLCIIEVDDEPFSCCDAGESCLPPLSTCDFGGRFLFSDEMSGSVPSDKFGEWTADGPVVFEIASTGRVTGGGKNFVLRVAPHKAEIDLAVRLNYGVLGACCDPCDGTCFETTEDDCVASGGVYQGDFVSCEAADCQVQGRCCLDCPDADTGALFLDGATPESCAAAGGSFLVCGDCSNDPCPGFDDCNANGVPDGCDISDGTSADCDTNGIPDECQPDCDNDGVPDACVIVTTTASRMIVKSIATTMVFLMTASPCRTATATVSLTLANRLKIATAVVSLTDVNSITTIVMAMASPMIASPIGHS